jgi:transportin-1
LGKIPDFANYLAYILTQMPNEETTVRSVSGLILKNHLSQMGDQIPAESVEYVKSVIIPALSLREDILRRTATQVIAMLMAILLPVNWLDGLSRLMQLIESSNVEEAEVSTSQSPSFIAVLI